MTDATVGMPDRRLDASTRALSDRLVDWEQDCDLTQNPEVSPKQVYLTVQICYVLIWRPAVDSERAWL